MPLALAILAGLLVLKRRQEQPVPAPAAAQASPAAAGDAPAPEPAAPGNAGVPADVPPDTPASEQLGGILAGIAAGEVVADQTGSNPAVSLVAEAGGGLAGYVATVGGAAAAAPAAAIAIVAFGFARAAQEIFELSTAAQVEEAYHRALDEAEARGIGNTDGTGLAYQPGPGARKAMRQSLNAANAQRYLDWMAQRPSWETDEARHLVHGIDTGKVLGQEWGNARLEWDGQIYDFHSGSPAPVGAVTFPSYPAAAVPVLQARVELHTRSEREEP